MTLITVRKGTSSQWSVANPVLVSGEPGFDLTNNLFKVGNGSSTWSGLPYYGSGLFSEIGHSHTISDIINFNSDISGLIPNVSGTGYLVSSFNTSNNNYILSISGLQPSGNYASFIHNHLINDISGLQDALDNKQGSGNYASTIHSHNILDIINFASGVSGFVPVKNITASTGIFVSGVDGVYNIAVTGNFGFNGSEIDSRVSGYLQAGSGIVFNYSDNNLTINSIATGTGTSNINYNDLENVVDNYFDTFLAAGTGINFSYNNNTLTINSNLVNPPLLSNSNGSIGQFSYDSEYFYVCISTNLWKRTALNTW
jgi:hypothetical protein